MVSSTPVSIFSSSFYSTRKRRRENEEG